MGFEEKTSIQQTKEETHSGNGESSYRQNPEWRKEMPMTKHPYQTCLRMPLTLKEDMTSICDRYQINESDLMRRAIVEFVTNVNDNPEQYGKFMFI